MSIRASVLASMLALSAVAVGPGMSRSSLPAQAGAMDPLGVDFSKQDLVMAGNGCGMERWAVKTASDSDRNLVSTTQHLTTIDALRSVRAPSSLPSSNRVRPTELTEYVIAGTLTGYKQEADGDIHLIITNSAGRTMIAELADPRCVVAARFRTEISNVRRLFLSRYRPDGTMRNPHRAIRVRGIGFFDYRHGQAGVAPNGIELHPVLGLGFP